MDRIGAQSFFRGSVHSTTPLLRRVRPTVLQTVSNMPPFRGSIAQPPPIASSSIAICDRLYDEDVELHVRRRPSACDHTARGSIEVATNVYLDVGTQGGGSEDELDVDTADDVVDLDDSTCDDDADPRPSRAPYIDVDTRPWGRKPSPSACAPDVDLDPRPSRAPDTGITDHRRSSLGWYQNKAGDWKFRGCKRPGKGAQARLIARHAFVGYRGARRY